MIQMQFSNEPSAAASRRPLYSSYDVIVGHENVYFTNFSQNRGRAVGEVSCLYSLYLSRQDASKDMQYGVH